jgi:hypothetical protein
LTLAQTVGKKDSRIRNFFRKQAMANTQASGTDVPYERNGLIIKARDVIFARENGPIDLVDRKVFNYLLNRVYGDLSAGAEFVHRLPVKDVLRFLKHSSTDRLRDSLIRLAEVDIVLRYEENGVRTEGRLHYLSYKMGDSEDGYIEFSFDPLLIRSLHNPKIFGQLQASHFQKFRSNYAAKLYEIMSVYVHRRSPHWTVSVDDFRSVMGVGEGYDRWDNLRKRVVDPAVAEADEIALFHVEVEYIRTGKGGRVTSMRFTARPKGVTTLLGMHAEDRSSRRGGRARDPNTIDLLDGQTDLERDPTAISQEAMEAALEIIGGEEQVDGYLEQWRTETGGRRITNPDRSFLNWLDLQVAKKREAALSIIDEDTFSGLLEAWDSSK